METINKSDLIPILQNSQLASQFDDEITVPTKFIINVQDGKIIIKNNNHLFVLLDQLRYWMIINLPCEIYDYIYENRLKLDKSKFDNFKDFFHKELVLLAGYSKNSIMRNCAEHGLLNLIKYIYDRELIESYYVGKDEYGNWSDQLCFKAIQNDHLETLKYLIEKGYKYDKSDVYAACIAAQNGNIEILKYLHNKGYKFMDCICDDAAGNTLKHFECLKYLMSIGYDIKKVDLTEAIDAGMEMLKFVLNNGLSWKSDYNHKFTIENLCKTNNFEMLKYAYETGHKWHQDTTKYIIDHFDNTIEVLKYVLDRGCKWSEHSISAALQSNKLYVLDFALAHNTHITDFAIEYAAKNNQIDILKKLWKKFKDQSPANYNSPACEILVNSINKQSDDYRGFKYLVENGCYWSNSVLKVAAKNHCQEHLKYAISIYKKKGDIDNQLNRELGVETVYRHSSNGTLIEKDLHTLEILKLLKSYNFPLTKECLFKAAEYGYHECVKYIIENGSIYMPRMKDKRKIIKQLVHNILRCYAGCGTNKELDEAQRLKSLKYVYEYNKKHHKHVRLFHNDRLRTVLYYKYMSIVKFILKHSNVHLNHYDEECIKNSMQSTIGESTCNYECFKIIYDHGFTFNKNICDIAAEHNQLKILKMLVENGHLVTQTTFIKATIKGCDEEKNENKGLDCLKYLHNAVLTHPKHKQPLNVIHTWLENTLVDFILDSNLDGLKYVIENICSCKYKCRYYQIEKPNAPYQCPTYFSKKKNFKNKLLKKFITTWTNKLRGADYYGYYTEHNTEELYINSLMY